MKRLLLTNVDSKSIAAVVNNNVLVDYAEHSNTSVGNIYKAQIVRKLTEINALFANIGNGQQVFVNCDDIPADIPTMDGCYLLVQITRPAAERKVATATAKIKLPGEYLIYMPLARLSGISKKICLTDERQRFVDFLKLYPNNKFVVRTAARVAAFEQLQEEAELLIKSWHQLMKRYEVEVRPRLLFRELDFILRYARDNIARHLIDEIVVDEKNIALQLREFISQSDYQCKVDFVESSGNLLALYHVDAQIAELNSRELMLANGVRISLDYCEAITAIDVNSGSYISSDNAKNAIVDINGSAAREIIRQIRLRNLAGIIVVDFLKMDEQGRETVVKVLREEAGLDGAKIEILGFTRAGLLEILRKSLSFNVLVDKSKT